MRKVYKITILLILAVFTAIFLSACSELPFLITITFDSDGGVFENGENTIILTRDSNSIITLPEDPIKDGYDFVGWFWNNNGTESDFNEESLKDISKREIIVYAKWKDETFTLSFETNGGNYIAPISLEPGATITLPSEPIKEGYSFCGWYYDEDFSEIYILETMPSENIILYADWGTSGLFYTLINENTEYSVSKGTTEDFEHIIIPIRYNGKPVTKIEDIAFAGCFNLISIRIPYKVTSIGDFAFYACESLSNITLPDSITSIGNFVFYACSSLSNVTLPDSIASIGEMAFGECNSLTRVIFGDNSQLSSIDSSAFYYCSLLSNINIPNSVERIGMHAFSATAWYTNQPDGLVYAGKVAYNYKGKMPANTSITLLEGTKGITSGAFYECSNLIDINIPESVTNIGNSAFYNTGIWNNSANNSVIYVDKWVVGYKGAITNVQLLSDTIGISDEALFGCMSLESITVPPSVKSIGNNALIGCSNLENIEVSENNENYKSIDGVLFNKAGTELIQYPIGNSRTSYTMPSSVTDIGSSAFASSNLTSIILSDNVTSIGSWAFIASKLTSITIPNNVTSIGSFAFTSCGSLASIIFEDNSQLTSIGSGAFSFCNSLININIPAMVTSIRDYTFRESSNLASITFENNSQLISIGRHAFQNCISLASVTIPDSVTSIGFGAFYGCSSLTGVNFEENSQLISIENDAFRSCSSLTSITIPSSVTTIGDYAFENCSGLTSIIIPGNVTSIGTMAFYRCSSLARITIESATPPILGSNNFELNHSTLKIYVPNGSVDIYKSASRWSTYASRIFAID